MHRNMQLFQLPRAEEPRNQNTRAGGDAHKKSDQHVDQRRARTDGSQRLMPDKVADDNRVDRVVEQLE